MLLLLDLRQLATVDQSNASAAYPTFWHWNPDLARTGTFSRISSRTTKQHHLASTDISRAPLLTWATLDHTWLYADSTNFPPGQLAKGTQLPVSLPYFLDRCPGLQDIFLRIRGDLLAGFPVISTPTLRTRPSYCFNVE